MAAPARIAVGVPEGNFADCPYKGLVPYSEADTAFFFGRERDREIIVANLIASRITLLYGASGIGKSSVLRAGVIPDLRQLAQLSLEAGRGPEYVPVILDRWTGDPRAELRERVAEAVAALDMTVVPPPPNLDISAAVRAWAHAVDGSLLIMLDQFEEFLLYHARDEERQGALREIGAALSEPEVPANFLISIREDAVASLDEFKGRVPRLFDNRLRLHRLNARAALDAIELPIEAFNRGSRPEEHVTIEAALAGSVIKQVAAGRSRIADASTGRDEPGIETPFLQLVMTTLWNAETESGSRRLRFETLQRLGGASAIVRSHLARRMTGLSAAEQGICAKVFHQLVTPSGTKVAHRLADLVAYSGIPADALEAVLSKLADPGWRILRVVSDEGTQSDLRYEIFHDVLAAAVLDWRAQYLAQRAAAEIVANERQRARQRRTRWLRTVLIGVLAVIAGVSLVAAVLTRSGAADDKRRQSEASSRALALASDRELGLDPMRALGLAFRAADERPTPEAVTALRAALAGTRYRRLQLGAGAVVDADISADGRLAFLASDGGGRELWRLGDEPSLAARFTPGGANTLAGRFSPDGKAIATVETGTATRLLRSGDRPIAMSLPCDSGRVPVLDTGSPRPVPAPVTPVWLGPRRVATACFARATVWDSASPSRVVRLVSPSNVTAMGASGNGRRLVIGDAGGSIATWEASADRRAHMLRERGAIRALAVDWQGDLAVATTARGVLRAIRLDGHAARPLPGVARADLSVIAVSPDGRWAAAGGQDGRVRLWDTHTGLLVNTLTGHTSGITSIAFSRSGGELLTASLDRTARLWDVRTGAALGAFAGHTDAIRRAVFGSGQLSGTVVTASADGIVRAWPVESRAPHTIASDAEAAHYASREGDVLLLSEHGGAELRLHDSGRETIARSGRWRDAAVSSDMRTAALVPQTGVTARPVSVVRLPDHRMGSLPVLNATAVAFVPNGKTLATADDDGNVRLWRTQDLTEIQVPGLDADRGLSDVLVTDDGKRVVAVGASGTFVWDIRSGRIVAHRNDGGTAVASNSNASRVVSVGAGAASSWEPAGDRLRNLVVPGDAVRAAAITADGSVVATGGQSGTIGLWDGSTGEHLDSLRFGSAPIRALDFNSDDTSLVATTTAGAVRELDCEICQRPEALIALARRRSAR